MYISGRGKAMGETHLIKVSSPINFWGAPHQYRFHGILLLFCPNCVDRRFICFLRTKKAMLCFLKAGDFSGSIWRTAEFRDVSICANAANSPLFVQTRQLRDFRSLFERETA